MAPVWCARGHHPVAASTYPAAMATTTKKPTTGTKRPRKKSRIGLGIDVGGTGVKAALVDLDTAELVSDRIREKTPQPSTPKAVLETISSVVEQVFAKHAPSADVPVGCGLPGPIKGGVMMTAANLDAAWVGYNAHKHISERLGRDVQIINDADAAGVAELAFGEVKGREGTVILLTIGTGIGSALFSGGRLVPNTEFGHLEMRGKAAEKRVSGTARERRKLSWKAWASEFNEYLAMLDLFFLPDTIILGGGVSKRRAKFEQFLDSKADIVAARFLNTSGIIGAAVAAGMPSSK
jgi:polyphosphate glucokinase